MEPADKGRKDVAVLRVVVVVGTVQVRRHNADEVCAVLTVQIFAVLKPRYLGKRVRLVGTLQRASKEAVLTHRLGCKTRVDARRPQELQLAAAVTPCGMDDVHPEHHVLVHEVRRGRVVRHDAADLRCSEEHVLRPLLREEGLHVGLAGKIQLRVRPCYYVVVALPPQLANDRRADHAAVTRDVYFGILLHMI